MEEQNTETNVSTPETKVEETQQNLHKERTEKEKAEFSLRKNAERLKELGGDPVTVLGVKLGVNNPILEEDDDAPLTIGKLKELQRQEAKKTAISLAEEIPDESERQEVVELLKTRIISSGDPQADLILARGAVNSKRSALIAEEANRRTTPQRTAAGASQPANRPEDVFEPTAEEAVFMRPPYNVSKEKILEARRKAQEKK